jgi:hypothetical protein
MNRLPLLALFSLLLPGALAGTPWRGVQLQVGSEAAIEDLGKNVAALAKDGVNVIVAEVDYNYQFTSRPEMADPNGITKEGARAFAKICRENHVRVIPQINCLGHQSWAEHTDTLLRVHPELDETPGMYPNNKGIYCRSWCPLNPDLPKIVFPLVDELIDAFQASAFHCGMDEVFIIGSDSCPRCHGKNHAELFAKSVNDFHDHLKKKHIQMFMWGDRFLDGKATGYGEWEASEVDTSPAIDMVPKDIVLCDWHYEKQADYPSIKILTDKGFRVWPSTWRNAAAATAFSTEGKEQGHGKVVGTLCTVWGAAKIDQLPAWPPLLAAFAPYH